MSERTSTSILGSLLREISWVGSRNLAKYYRDGGVGVENVLTAEVLQGLDFLPRQHFLGAVINELEGNVLPLKQGLLAEIEGASVSLLSEHFYLSPSEQSHDTKIDVQPDAVIVSRSVFCLIESKRKGGSFGPEQLAREFVITTREAQNHQPILMPMLMLILGEEPRVRVRGAGRRTVQEAILEKLEDVREMTEDHPKTYADLKDMVDTSVAWITWGRIADIIRRQMRAFTIESPSVHDSIQRLADAVTRAIERHGLSGS
jgi:hypothetical protein